MKASVCGVEFVMCDGYIDQGRFIGDDPVGCKCSAPATRETEDGYDVCDWCASNPERVTFDPRQQHGTETM